MVQPLEATASRLVNTSCHMEEFDYICENRYEGPFVVEKFESEDVEGFVFERLCYNGTEGGWIKTRYFGEWLDRGSCPSSLASPNRGEGDGRGRQPFPSRRNESQFNEVVPSTLNCLKCIAEVSRKD